VDCYENVIEVIYVCTVFVLSLLCSVHGDSDRMIKRWWE